MSLYVQARNITRLNKSVVVPDKNKVALKGKSPVDSLEKDEMGYPDYSYFSQNKKKLMENSHQITRHGKGGKWHVSQDGDVSYDKPAAGFTPKPIVDPEGKPVKPMDDSNGFMKTFTDAAKRARVKVPLHVLSKMAEAAHEAAERSKGDHRSLSEKGINGDNEKAAKQKVYTEPFLAAMKVGEEYLPGPTLRPLMERAAGDFRDGVSHHLSDGTHTPIGMTLGAVARHHVTSEERRDGRDVPDILTDDKDKAYHSALMDYTKQVKGSSGPASGSKKYSGGIEDKVAKLKETGKHHAQDVRKMRQRTNEEDAKVPANEKEERARKEASRVEAEHDSKQPPLSDEELQKLGEIIMELHINPDRFAEIRGLPEGTRSGRHHIVQGLATEHEGESSKVETERQSAEVVLARALVRGLQHRANGHITNGIQQGGSKAWHIIAHGNTLKDRHQMARAVVDGAHNEPENSIAAYLGLDSMRVARAIVQSLPDPETYAKELQAAGMVPKEIKGGPDKLAEKKKTDTKGTGDAPKSGHSSPSSLIIKSKKPDGSPKLFLGFSNSHVAGQVGLPIRVNLARLELLHKSITPLGATRPQRMTEFSTNVMNRTKKFSANPDSLSPNHTAPHLAEADAHVNSGFQDWKENPNNDNIKTSLVRKVDVARHANQLHDYVSGQTTEPPAPIMKVKREHISLLDDPSFRRERDLAIRRHTERIKSGTAPIEQEEDDSASDPHAFQLNQIRKLAHQEVANNAIDMPPDQQPKMAKKSGRIVSTHEMYPQAEDLARDRQNQYIEQAKQNDPNFDITNYRNYLANFSPEDAESIKQQNKGKRAEESIGKQQLAAQTGSVSGENIYGVPTSLKAYPYNHNSLFEMSPDKAEVNTLAHSLGTERIVPFDKVKKHIIEGKRRRIPRGESVEGDREDTERYESNDKKIREHPDAENLLNPQTQEEYEQLMNAKTGNHETTGAIPSTVRDWTNLPDEHPDSLKNFMGSMSEGTKDAWRKTQDHINEMKQRADNGLLTKREVAMHYIWGKLTQNATPFHTERAFIGLQHDPTFLRYLNKSLNGSFSTQDMRDLQNYITNGKKNGKHDLSTTLAMTPPLKKLDKKTYQTYDENHPNVKNSKNEVGDKVIDTSKKSLDLASILRNFSKQSQHEGEDAPMSHWDRLHSWHSDPNMSGRELRRNFWRHGMGGQGLNNKIVSLTSNMLGKRDVGVVDTIHAQHLHKDMFDKLQKATGLPPEKLYGAITSAYNGIEGLGAYETFEDMMKNASKKHYNEHMSDEDKKNGLMSNENDVAGFNNGAWLHHDQRETNHSALHPTTEAAQRALLEDEHIPTSQYPTAGDYAQIAQKNQTEEGRQGFKENIFERGKENADETEKRFARLHLPSTEGKSWDDALKSIGGNEGLEEIRAHAAKHGVGMNVNHTANGVHLSLVGKDVGSNDAHKVVSQISEHIKQKIKDNTGIEHEHSIHHLTSDENSSKGLSFNIANHMNPDSFQNISNDIKKIHPDAKIKLLPNGNLHVLTRDKSGSEKDIHTMAPDITNILYKNKVGLYATNRQNNPDAPKSHVRRIYWKGYHHDEEKDEQGKPVFKSYDIQGARWEGLPYRRLSSRRRGDNGSNISSQETGWRRFKSEHMGKEVVFIS